jgi:hypothetical protein
MLQPSREQRTPPGVSVASRTVPTPRKRDYKGHFRAAPEVLEPTLAVAEGYEFASGSRPPTGSKRRQSWDGVEGDHSPGSTIAFQASINFSKSGLRNGDLLRHNKHTTPSSSTSGWLPQRLQHITAIGSRPSLNSYQVQVSSWISTRSFSGSGPAAATAFPHSAHTYVDTLVKPGNVFSFPQCGHVALAHSSLAVPSKYRGGPRPPRPRTRCTGVPRQSHRRRR